MADPVRYTTQEMTNDKVQEPTGLVSTPQAPQAAPLPSNVKAPGYTPATATSTGYQATPYKVEPQGLVQERIKGIVNEDSPLMQQAARIAAQKSNDRGLVNSSMAVGDAQQAVISAAAPIAQVDANSINTAMTNTANQENAASQFKATASNNVSLANQAAANDALKAKQAGEVNLILGNLDAQTKIQLTDMDNRTRSLLQTNQSASNAYVQTVQNIGQISQSTTMNAAAKKTAIDNQINLLRQQLATLSGIDATTGQSLDLPQSVVDLDLGKYFQTADSPSPTPAKATATPTNPAGTKSGGLINEVQPETPKPVAPTPIAPSQPAVAPGAATGGGFGVPNNAPASGTRANPGGTNMPGKPGSPGRIVPTGSPPPYPGAVKVGTTVVGGGRQIYDVYQ